MMGSDFQFLDIILFAAVAGFLLLRLRSVLGRRTGNERRPTEPFAPPSPVVVPLAPPATANSAPAAPVAVGQGLGALKTADPTFNEESFLKGARAAFDIVLKSYAIGDTATLQRLVSPDVFAAFAEAIRTRQAAKQTMETTLSGIKSAEIVDVTIQGTTSLVAVKLVSDQTHATRAADGTVVDGDPEKAVEQTDIWTFSRPLRARDPNWILIATHSP